MAFDGPSTVSLWESGRVIPAPATIKKLATALNCPPADLVAGVVSPLDAMRGLQELPGPDILLSDAELRHMTL